MYFFEDRERKRKKEVKFNSPMAGAGEADILKIWSARSSLVQPAQNFVPEVAGEYCCNLLL